MAGIGWVLLDKHEFFKAEGVLRESLAMREELYTDESAEVWRLFNVLSLLGGALAGQAEDLMSADPDTTSGWSHRCA